MAAPTPAWSTGSEPITDSVQGAKARPVPRPISKNAGNTSMYVSWTVTRVEQPESQGDESHSGEDDRFCPDHVVHQARERSDDQ